MEDNTRYITDRIWKKILPPALISNIFNLITLHLGTFFLVSRYCPKQELVVYSAFLPFWFLFFILEYIFAIAGSQYFSIFKGAGKHPDAQRVFAESFTVQLVSTVVVFLLAVWQMPRIVQFLGIPRESVPMALTFGKLMIICGLTDVTVTMMRHFIQSDSLPKTGALLSTTQSTIMFLSMYVFFCVFHYGLIPYYWFFLLINFLSVLAYIGLILCGKTTIKLRLGWMCWQDFKELISLSGNHIINNAGSFIISLLTTRWLMSVFGPASVTIFALLSMLTSCSCAVQKGYSSSSQALVGVYRGEENINGIRISFRKGFWSGLYLQLGFTLFLFCFPELVCRWMQVLENFPGEAVLAVRLFALSNALRYAYSFLSGHYTVCGHERLIAFCSIVGNVLLCLLVTVFFLLILRNEHILWWYYPGGWMLTLFFLLAAIYWKKVKGKYQNFLLLNPSEAIGKRYHFLLKNRSDDFQDYRTMLGAFLRKQAISEADTIRVKHLFEELFLFAGEQIGDRKNALFSIVVTIWEKNVELALRYDSRESCLKTVLNGAQIVLDADRVAGAKILSRLSDRIYIDRVYGINYIRLTLNRSLI